MSLEEITMNFWQRALKSITRRKGKSFILFLVLFILGNVIAGAVAIQQSTANVERETKRKMGNVATVEMDWEGFEKDNADVSDEERSREDFYPKPPALDVYEQIGQLSYVKYFDYQNQAWLETTKLKAYTPEDGSVGMGGNYFTLKGGNLVEPLDMQEGLIRLEEGEGLTEKDVSELTNAVLISKEIAELNNLSVGDQLVWDTRAEVMMEEGSSEAVSDDSEDATDETAESGNRVATFDYPVTIAGIFSVVKKDQSNQGNSSDQSNSQNSDQIWKVMDQINTFYASNNLVQDFNKLQSEKLWGQEVIEEESDAYYQPIFVLNSTDDVEAFKQEAGALLPQYYRVIANTDQYEQIAGGFTRLGVIANYIVIIASIATIFIISLVVLLFLRDRKQELGIYLSLGESRGKVIGQIVIEVLLVSLAALLLSLVTGNLLGGAVSNTLMQNDWMSNQNDMGGVYSGGLMAANIDYMDIKNAYQVSFSAGYIITYLLLGLGTVLLSAILPLLYILRLNPKKIMM
ncbi:FtsX-like permease family protein [Enterococcus casseliflavus]|uniref:FtsX-like permease family protein n=1 Tax=Enterococcus casseliflavus TaxID=37734 RepID=UPI0011A6790C|nr:ABC transporter permease [Enterococcus casseliflavus]